MMILVQLDCDGATMDVWERLAPNWVKVAKGAKQVGCAHPLAGDMNFVKLQPWTQTMEENIMILVQLDCDRATMDVWKRLAPNWVKVVKWAKQVGWTHLWSGHGITLRKKFHSSSSSTRWVTEHPYRGTLSALQKKSTQETNEQGKDQDEQRRQTWAS